jgi:hypothetical protein
MQSMPSGISPTDSSRRAVIRAGALGLLGGLGMGDLARLKASPKIGSALPTAGAKSVIYVFLSGGLAQHESFDMKPDAPIENRGEFNPISTKTAGIQICEYLPQLAKISDKWALVRSLTHQHNEHSQGHHVMLTGHSEQPAGFSSQKPQDTDDPSITAVANSLLRPRGSALTPVVVMPDKIVHRTGRVIPGQFAGPMGKSREPWFLNISPYHPQHYGAYPEYLFHHASGAKEDAGLTFRSPQLTLPSGLNLKRVADRVALRQDLQQQSRLLESVAGDAAFDRYQTAAIDLLANGESQNAFDLSKADPKQIERYGDHSFGWSLLMARNLVESGVNLVQVNLGNNETWDTHQAAFPNLKNFLLPPLDQSLSALLEDLDASGLLDETMVVVASEFGRTPKISRIPSAKLPGRDHWGAVQSVLFAGGGVKGGNVIGSSDKIGAYPAEDPQKPENFAATIYHALGIPRDAQWHDLSRRPFPVYHADPIKGLT